MLTIISASSPVNRNWTPIMIPFDVSDYAGLSYWFKGSAHVVVLSTLDVEDDDFYGIEIDASDEWKRLIVPFRDLHQTGFGNVVPLRLTNATPASSQRFAFTSISL